MKRALALAFALVFAAAAPAAAYPSAWTRQYSPFIGGTLTNPVGFPTTNDACDEPLAAYMAGEPTTGFQLLGAGRLGFCVLGVLELELNSTSAIFGTSIVVNSAGGTDLAITEAGIDRNSASVEYFTGTNSGAGVLLGIFDGWKGISNALSIYAADDVKRGEVRTFSASTGVGWLDENGGGFWKTSNGSFVGMQGDRTATQVAGCFADGQTTGSGGTAMFCSNGEGRASIPREQVVTCAAGGGVAAITTDITSSMVYLDNNDADGCDWTPVETTAVLDSFVYVTVRVHAGGIVRILDSANVVVAGASCDTTGMVLGGQATGIYVDAGNPFYSFSCSN